MLWKVICGFGKLSVDSSRLSGWFRVWVCQVGWRISLIGQIGGSGRFCMVWKALNSKQWMNEGSIELLRIIMNLNLSFGQRPGSPVRIPPRGSGRGWTRSTKTRMILLLLMISWQWSFQLDPVLLFYHKMNYVPSEMQAPLNWSDELYSIDLRWR